MTDRRPLLVALSSIVLTASVLGALEFACRGHMPRPDDQLYDANYVRFLIDAAGPVLVRRNIDGVDYLVPKAAGSPYVQKDQRFPLFKKPGVKRIVVVGESSGLGLGASLRSTIQHFAPERGIEVLNLAFGGASLEQVENNYREALRYKPDVLILCFGHNLMMVHPPLSPLALRFNSAIRKSHLMSLLLDRQDRPKLRPIALNARMAALQGFIRDSARLARDNNIPLMICTMPSNLRFPPDSDEPEREAPPYLASLYEAVGGHDGAALTILRDAADATPVALWDYQAAEGLLRRGDSAAARERFLAARNLDPMHDRAATQVNNLIRAVGREENLVVLDMDEMVTAAAPHEIPGWESFIDHVHLSMPVLEFVGSRCWLECRGLLEVRGEKTAPSSTQWEPMRSPRWGWEPTDWRKIALDAALKGPPYGAQRSAAVRSIFAYELRTNRPDFTLSLRALLADEAKFEASPDPSSARAYLALNAADASFWAGRDRDAARYDDLARRWSPNWAEPYFVSGLLAVRAHADKKALGYFQKAVALEPGRRDAAYFLARLAGNPR